jgi:carboxymethylenebutenolidase
MSNVSLDRRDFVALTTAVGIGAAVTTAHAAEPKVTEKDVTIRTRDGNCDAAFFHPATGKHAAVVIWADIFGLRPAFRDMGRRLAAEGYAVLVPNPFYRTQKAPLAFGPGNFNFQSDADRAKLPPLTGPLNAAGAAESDAQAFVAWLDQQPQVDASKKIGTQGYCMGGPLIMKTAAAVPDRIGAAASFHGGGLTTANPDSPHLLLPRIKAKLFIAVAQNDDARDPESKTKLKEAAEAAKVSADIEVYKAQHGWCVPDFTGGPNPIYDRAEAERAWTKLLALYRSTLA